MKVQKNHVVYNHSLAAIIHDNVTEARTFKVSSFVTKTENNWTEQWLEL